MQPVWEWLSGYATRWHDLWEIVGALGSAAAAGVALWLASRERVDRKAAEKDRDVARAAQLRAERAAERRELEAQARQVVVWVETWASSMFSLEGSSGPIDRASIILMNCSSMPIIDVSPVLIDAEGVGDLLGEPRAALEPGEKFRSPEIVLANVSQREYAAYFRDAAGRHWVRAQHGGLEEVLG